MLLGECPLWHTEQQTLYWVDIPGKAVHSLHPAKNRFRTWPMATEPGAIALCKEGILVALRSGLAMLNVDSGELTALSDAPYDTAKLRYNDGRVDAAGRFWVGSIFEPRDRPGATLYSIAHGKLIDHEQPATVSNGLAFSPDNRTLYRSDTTSHTVFAYDYDLEQGKLGARRILREFSQTRDDTYIGRPDGGAVDSEGAYWCAMMEGGRLLRLSPEGEILREIMLPARCPTMLCFGGPDLRTLYITTSRNGRPDAELKQYPMSGCLLTMEIDVAGLPEHHYRSQ
ncbi:MAG TPA: SMP-30/gluconolactonase/LRE family protein [Burkholderiaceae bacterium]